MKSKSYSQCANCWWYDACLGTIKACHKFQEVDFHWKESPNNKHNKEGGLDERSLLFFGCSYS